MSRYHRVSQPVSPSKANKVNPFSCRGRGDISLRTRGYCPERYICAGLFREGALSPMFHGRRSTQEVVRDACFNRGAWSMAIMPPTLKLSLSSFRLPLYSLPLFGLLWELCFFLVLAFCVSLFRVWRSEQLYGTASRICH